MSESTPVIERKMTRLIDASDRDLSDSELNDILGILENSGVLILPTDTVYGLACNAFDPVAIQKVYALKGRDYSKPLPVLLSSVAQLPLAAKEVPPEVFRLTKRFWPGPLTVVLRTAPIAMHASRGKETIAVRVPDHGVLARILSRTQLPMAATSANRSGEKSVKTGAAAVKQFMDKVDLIVDGGDCRHKKESTVVDAVQFPFTVLRTGVLSKDELYEQLYESAPRRPSASGRIRRGEISPE